METIQVVVDSKLLHAADAVARRARVNRSALIREALREYLKRLQRGELEARDRRGYEKHPNVAGEAEAWEQVAAWPRG
jgi:metal-responsive CopG/Arc/MetJ family transcriptional regulator